MKQTLKLIGLIAIIGLAFFGCKEEGSPTHKCPSLDVHYLTCEEYGCTIGGHTQKALDGYDNKGFNFPIYQTKNVDHDKAVAVAGNTCLALEAVNYAPVANKIEAIRIVSGNSITNTISGEKYIVNIGCDATAGAIYTHLATNITMGYVPYTQATHSARPRIVPATVFC